MVLIKLSAVDSELGIAAGMSVLQTIQWAWRVSLGSFKASITDKEIRRQRFHVCKPLGCMKLCHPMSWQEASSLPLFPLPKVPCILYKPLPDLQEPTRQPAATAALVCPKAAGSKARSCALHPPVSEPGQVTAISCLPSHQGPEQYPRFIQNCCRKPGLLEGTLLPQYLKECRKQCCSEDEGQMPGQWGKRSS